MGLWPCGLPATDLGVIYYPAWGLLGLLGGQHVRYHLGVDVFGTWVHIVEGLVLIGIWQGCRLAVRSSEERAPISA